MLRAHVANVCLTATYGCKPSWQNVLIRPDAGYVVLSQINKNTMNPRIAYNRTALCNLTLGEDEAIDAYVTRAVNIRMELKAAEEPATVKELNMAILRGLPEDYNTERRIILRDDKLMDDTASLQAVLVERELELKQLKDRAAMLSMKAPPAAPPAAPPTAGGQSKKFKRKPWIQKKQQSFKPKFKPKFKRELRSCFHCGKPGHVIKDCRLLKQQQQQQAAGQAPRLHYQAAPARLSSPPPAAHDQGEPSDPQKRVRFAKPPSRSR